jgi:hypothetical protein
MKILILISVLFLSGYVCIPKSKFDLIQKLNFKDGEIQGLKEAKAINEPCPDTSHIIQNPLTNGDTVYRGGEFPEEKK